MDPVFVPKAPMDVPSSNSNYHPYFQKLMMPFLALLVLAIGLGVSVKLVGQRQSPSKASNQLVDITVSAPDSLKSGQEFSAVIGLSPNDYRVSVVDLKVNYSPNLEYLSFKSMGVLPNTLTPASVSQNQVSLKLAAATPTQNPGIIGVINFKVKKTTEPLATIKVDPATRVDGFDSAGNPLPTSILGLAGQSDIKISN